MIMNKFWQCVAQNRCIHMDASILEWLGYDNEQIVMIMNKFCQCVAGNMRIHMDAHILEWLGYDNEQILAIRGRKPSKQHK